MSAALDLADDLLLPPPAGLRRWQLEALPIAEDPTRKDVLIEATPGAGKTRFALTVAKRALDAGVVSRVVVVAPTDHLRTQWADAAAQAGVNLDPTLSATDPVPTGMRGWVTTYAQVARNPVAQANRVRQTRTLVLLDECHHAGDGKTWGDSTRFAFAPATRRLSLSGTPFRTGVERIPFVTYHDVGDELVSRPDYRYGYREALADGVVRPVMFAAYSGSATWQAGAKTVTFALEEGSKKQQLEVWRRLLDPTGVWARHVIAATYRQVCDLRAAGAVDAAGLILASDMDSARAYAELVEDMTGVRPVLALSDDPQSSNKIEQFRVSNDPLIIAVRQVSEGVDLPRTAVLAWMCSYRTPLFFAQAVGRVVRSTGDRTVATVFLPAVRPLLELAGAMEDEREHVVAAKKDDADDPDAEPVDRLPPLPPGPREPTADSEARFAHVMQSGRAVTAGDADAMGLFTADALSPEQLAALLTARDQEIADQARQHRRTHRTGTAPAGRDAASTPLAAVVDDDPLLWRTKKDLRAAINKQVSRIAASRGQTHPEVHIAARRAAPGPASAKADIDVLTARLRWLRSQ